MFKHPKIVVGKPYVDEERQRPIYPYGTCAPAASLARSAALKQPVAAAEPAGSSGPVGVWPIAPRPITFAYHRM